MTVINQVKALLEGVRTQLRAKRKAWKHALKRGRQGWRAAYVRARSGATFIAVTGSSGKSTTAALMAHIASEAGPVRAQFLTNVPSSHVRSLLTRLPSGYFVGELSAICPGSLRPAIDAIRPSVGIVTLVALEHKSAFRTIEAVAEEKGRLIEALPANGLAVLNHDDPQVLAMARRTKARVVTFGQSGGDYVVVNIRCEAPGELRFDIVHQGQSFEIASRLTGTHQSVAVAASFACAHQLGIPAEAIIRRIESFEQLFGRCSVHRIANGPVFIVDTAKAPHHSIQLVLDMMASFNAPRKRIVIGQISDGNEPERVYRNVYRAARSVADQVIFVGEHSHRSKATAEDITAGRFVEKRRIRDAAQCLKETAMPGELILLKGAQNLHLERIMLNFETRIGCWEDVCGRMDFCVRVEGQGCGKYGEPFEHHKGRKTRQYPKLD